MRGVPAQARAGGRNAVALFQVCPRVRAGGPEEEVVEVLFAGEIRAPRREAHCAVVDRPEHVGPGWVLEGLQPVIAGRRAADLHRRLTRDAARVLGVLDHIPVAALGVRREAATVLGTLAMPLDFDDRDAVGVHRLAGLLRVPVGDAVGKEQPIVRVLVVLRQQAVPRAVDREVDHAVVVHPPLLGLIVGAVAGILRELRAPPTGSPQAIRTSAVYPLGTTTVSAVDTGMPVKPSSGPFPLAEAGTAFNSVVAAPRVKPAAAAKVPPMKPRRERRASTICSKVSLL